MIVVLREYQQRGVRYTIGREGWALFMEMRLGKTLTCIRALKMRSEIKRILIIAPYSAVLGWREEFEAEKCAWVEIFGEMSKGRREATLGMVDSCSPSARLWVLCNKEVHRSLGKHLIVRRWDAVVIDESTLIKNPTSSVTKFWLKFPHPLRQVRAVLTGTEMPESELDIFCQLKFIGLFQEYKDYYVWRARNFRAWRFGWTLFPKSREKLVEMMARETFKVKRRDVNLDGVKVYQKLLCQVPVKMRKVYRDAEELFVLKSLEGAVLQKTKSAGAQYQWLRQAASGWIEKELVSDHKIKLLDFLLSKGGELYKQQVVIWCQYVHEVLYLTEYLSNAMKVHGAVEPEDRAWAIKKFRAKECSFLVAQPETLKFGARLDTADAMIYFSSPESALTRQQTEDRTLSVSRLNGVLIIDLIAAGTVDESTYKSLKKKEGSALSMHRAVLEAKARILKK